MRLHGMCDLSQLLLSGPVCLLLHGLHGLQRWKAQEVECGEKIEILY